MDNIQFWIYVIFAIIYFVARNFKKTDKKKPVNKPTRSGQDVPQAQSFEELLEEITGRRTVKESQSEKEETIVEPDPFVEAFDERYMEPKPWQTKEEEEERRRDIENEGRNRKFADHESRRVYEESIKRAEGANIDYEIDKNYASAKVIRETAEEVKENKLAKEVRELFDDPNEARKAFIAAEIFNRKY